MKTWTLLRAGLALLALALAVGCAGVRAQAPSGPALVVLAFHDVRHQVVRSFETDPDASAVDVTVLAGFFEWMRAHGWQPVSLEQVLAAHRGGPALPPRPVLLTFDDGYASHYAHVFPLLRAFRYPAVMSLVTGWLEVPAGASVPYGGRALPRDRFLTWQQAQEMAASGLVEFASHSHDLHRGIPGNPQGNLMPAATTHAWLADAARYEDDTEWLRRVQSDLAHSARLLHERTGQAVRALAWPYGAWNAPAQAAAARAGLPVAFTLEDDANPVPAPLHRLRRTYVTYDMDVGALAAVLERRPAPAVQQLQRAMHVDLDYVYDPDPLQQERNLSLLLERVLAVGPRTVFLQAFADPDGDGAADAVYFPNRHLPVRADLFSRVAWQLRTRSEVEVYAWMPVLSFRLPPGHPAAQATVRAADPPRAGEQRYHRLSPFDPAARQAIAEIYDDLGRHAWMAGVLFHDDATLAQDEDAGAAAEAAYRAGGFAADLAAIRAQDAPAWPAWKARALTHFSLELAAGLRKWHPRLRTARNMYAQALLEPASVEWLAQDYGDLLHAYDHTVVMAMPFMEQVAQPAQWLTRVAQRVLATPGGAERTVLELQARDWRTGQPVPDAELAAQFRLLQALGIRHLAYYPDDFHRGHPRLETARAGVSVRGALSGRVSRSEPLPLTPPRASARGSETP